MMKGLLERSHVTILYIDPRYAGQGDAYTLSSFLMFKTAR